ncbi:dynamin family protein [Pseudomonas sp. GX19020]|uniref:dynamin family protein n=1 Tax=Pseudomonas sp. GX19020 TaxID=2942277 RepID=UPI002018D7A3|nr:dynamin family protein [Pseudomonas sp. GX19020]
MKIAPQLRQELAFLRDGLDRADHLVDPKTRPNFAPLRNRLEDWTARIAVIGQVKAGKSTFLNALLHQHDFLPSDINPWTSVVTNIRVNIASDPASGARFEFFDEADWQDIIDSGSAIRQLTEDLLPGFDSDLLRRQSEEMRERAQRRLGRHYHALLGSRHDHDYLSADLLKRYVCAGPGSDDGLDREALGRYAALTKSASIYMRLPEFDVPAIITDTPGVNDPFLLRDELTCRSLDKSDVFIMVLSAHQPLTDIDVVLIRILARQDDKDVVIFINRIDELDDYSIQVPRVIADVECRLRAAIPEIDFRVVAGSAWLADLVLRDDEEADHLREAADSDELAQYIRETCGRLPRERKDRLMFASGLNRLKDTLSATLDSGVGSQQLNQLRGDIRAELNAARFIDNRERDALRVQMESLRSDIARAAARDVGCEISGIRDLRNRLEGLVDAADAQIEQVVSKSWTGLEARLMEAIGDYVDRQKNAFEDRLFGEDRQGDASTTLDFDLLPLQSALEAEVRQCYIGSRSGTDAALQGCIQACRQAIGSEFQDRTSGNPTAEITLEGLPCYSFTSTLTFAKRNLRVGMILDRSWAFWRKPSLNVDKSLGALRMLTTEELRPSVEKILAAYNEAQLERASAGMSRIRVMLRMFDAILSENAIRLQQDKTDMERITLNPEGRKAVLQRLQSKIEALEHRLTALAALETGLKRPELGAAA